ncbi:MAG: CHAT domain-containing protein [Actinomycetota bacterium]|nr:CHAT domain-containing protein [Actinomycetota bacterium]
MGGEDGGGKRAVTGAPIPIDDLLGEESPAAPPRPKKAVAPPAPRSDRMVNPVQLRVIWGDLCKVAADVHVAGHYQGVMPTSAEGALDAAISGTDPSRRIIAEHTRRQWFLGDFGHVNYFPSDDPVVRLAAVAGMGRPGTFTEARCMRLAENLLVELCALGCAERVATVGIGSGAGNLSLDQTARGLAGGFSAALQSTRMTHPCNYIDIVEYDRLRAERFLAAFKVAVAGHETWLTLRPELETGVSGGVSFSSAAVYALQALARTPTAADGLENALADLGGPDLADTVKRRLKGADPQALVDAEVTVQQRADDPDRQPVRISVLEDRDGMWMRVAAITGTATVPERQIDTDPKLIDDIVRRMSPPARGDLPWMAELMSRLVLPGDLHALVSADSPLVFEVDRRTAQIHWELVVDLVRSSSPVTDAADRPLVLQTSVSRQLRTTYSRVPALDVQTAGRLKVLVIGDPGGEGFTLPEARQEAMAVRDKLRELNIWVRALIGAPPKDGTRSRPPADTLPVDDGSGTPTPAGRLDVLRELLSGDYQIVHYCGHGTFDPDDARRAGWLFADGLLTSRELAQLGAPPRLVVANACFTSRLGDTGAARTRRGAGAGGAATGAALAGDRTRMADAETQLTPSLADEFFKSGVANYVGAAWKVADGDAAVFSTSFYEHLLGKRDTLGDALTAARNDVWDHHPGAGGPDDRGTTWAAYQHYGDPTDRLLVDEDGGDGGS